MYPGHDYAGLEYAVLGEEKRSNPFLKKRTKEEYVAFVADFFPPIAESMSADGVMTLQCGTQRVLQSVDEVKTLTPEELAQMMQSSTRPLILDVREPAELTMLGAIEGVVNISVRQLANRIQELPAEKNSLIVCVCQSGSRSIEATHYLQKAGYSNVWNLKGGTSAWVKKGFRVVRPRQAVS
jgi:rhodanese-related sulfurtransferase